MIRVVADGVKNYSKQRQTNIGWRPHREFRQPGPVETHDLIPPSLRFDTRLKNLAVHGDPVEPNMDLRCGCIPGRRVRPEQDAIPDSQHGPVAVARERHVESVPIALRVELLRPEITA